MEMVKRIVFFARLLCLPLCLTGCGATGKLVGTVATIPVRIISGGGKFHDDGSALPEMIDIGQATSLNHSN